MGEFVTNNINMWEDIKNIIPKQFGGREGKNDKLKERDTRLFIDAVLYLIYEKEPYSLRMNWKDLPYEYGNIDNHAHRFNEWRKNGVWEKLLPTLIKHNKWLLNSGKYEILMTNYKLVRDINSKSAAYINAKNKIERENLLLYKYINDNLEEIQELLENIEIEKVMKKDKFWKNRLRRKKANSEHPRGTYWGKYPVGEYPDDPRA